MRLLGNRGSTRHRADRPRYEPGGRCPASRAAFSAAWAEGEFSEEFFKAVKAHGVLVAYFGLSTQRRGKGAGAALVEWLKTATQGDKRLRFVYLDCVRTAEARRFWTNAGFQPLDGRGTFPG